MLVFLFSGQGSQYRQMGRELYEGHPGFRKHLEELDGLARELIGESVLSHVFHEGFRLGERFERVLLSSPAIFMMEYALASVLQEEGVRPDCVLGTSLGEFSACAVAGAVEVEQALRLLVAHARALEERCEAGGMLTVLHEPELFHREPFLAEHCELAAVNLSNHFVVSGKKDALERVAAWLTARGISCQELPVAHAFHSSLLEPTREVMTELLHKERFRPPRVPVLSCVEGRVLTSLSEDHLWRTVREPILFRDAMKALEPHRADTVYVDLGPSGTLANMVRYTLGRDSASRVLSILGPYGRDLKNFEGVRARLAVPRAASPTGQSPERQKTMNAYVFPGQGSQKLGMGAGLFEEFPEQTARADAILGYSVRELCLEDPHGQLGQTQYTQPALYVVNALAFLKRQREEPRPPDFVAGHSLGEYNALFAAGAFDFETGLKLVHKRGSLMGQLQGGGMAAVVGMSEERIRQLLAENDLGSLDVANLNSPEQLVLSGPRADIERAQPLFQAARARLYMPLNVSGAFHSRYMAQARDELTRFLRQFQYSPPRIPVISNVEARPYTHERLVELLSAQLVSPVRWMDSVLHMLEQGVERFTEVGPGEVLTRLVDRIRKAAPASTPAPRASVPPPAEPPAAPAPQAPAPRPEAETARVRQASPGEVAPAATATEPPREAASQRAGRQQALLAEALGSAEFRREHGVRYAYVAGSMGRAISSEVLVERMAQAGLLSFFGTHGVPRGRVQEAITRLQQRLGARHPWGMNLVCDMAHPQAEEALVELFLAQGVRSVEASLYIQLTPALVRYRLKGLEAGPDGRVVPAHRILAKVSRPEVAEAFLSPPPERLVARLLAEGRITRREAELAARIPMADDVCVEGNPAWHSEPGSLHVLLPAVLELREQQQARHRYLQRVRVGAAGGIGTPAAAASAFLMGADFILTGSINQCTVEAGTSAAVKELLEQAQVQDTAYAPASDLFEMGARVQVLKKGLFFPSRASKLYELYQQYGALEELDAPLRRQLEERYFRRGLEDVQADVRAALASRAPQEWERATREPKHRMLLVFRWYLEQAEELAQRGDVAHRVDFQVPCSPALGAFNQWMKGTTLQAWSHRHVDEIAERLMQGAASFIAQRVLALVPSAAA